MADEIDKFVLKYVADTGEANKALEQLNKKTEKIGKDSSDAGKSLKDFASGAADEMGKLGGSIDTVSTALKGMISGFSGAAVAAAAVAVAVKSVNEARAQYSEQRRVGRDSGVSDMRVQDITDRYVGGNLNKDQINEALKSNQDTLRAAQADPTGLNEANKRLMVSHMSAFGKDGRPLSAIQWLQERQDAYRSMSDEAVQGMAAANGWNPDFEYKLKHDKNRVSDAQMTAKQAERYASGADETAKVNQEMAEFNQQMHDLYVVLGTELLPLLEPVTKLLTKGVKAVNSSLGQSSEDRKRQQDIETEIKARNAKLHGFGWSDGKSDAAYDAEVMNQARAQLIEEKRKAQEDANKKTGKPTDHDKVNQAMKERDKGPETIQNAATDLTRAVNVFSMAVDNMKGALNQNEILQNLFMGTNVGSNGAGMAAGAGVASGPNGAALGKWAAIPGALKPLFEKYEKQYGFAPGTLAGIASRESAFDPNARNKVSGATGLMQVMPDNYKAVGITDPTNAEQSINGGAQILRGFLNSSKGDMFMALRKYFAGSRPSAYNAPHAVEYGNDVVARQHAYAGTVAPESKRAATGSVSMSDRLYLNALAEKTGNTPQQILAQGISSGDMEKLRPYLLNQAHTATVAAQSQMTALATARAQGSYVKNGSEAQAEMSWQAAAAKEAAIRNGFDSGRYQREGAATAMTNNLPVIPNLTINSPITINGAEHPEAVAKAVVDHVNREVKNMVNQNTTQVVR